LTDPGFCPFVLEIFYLGITTGTTPTTYDPSSTVTRLQMAAFLSRTVSNGSDFVSIWKAADLTPIGSVSTGTSTGPLNACSDGVYFWIALADVNKLARF